MEDQWRGGGEAPNGQNVIWGKTALVHTHPFSSAPLIRVMVAPTITDALLDQNWGSPPPLAAGRHDCSGDLCQWRP